MAKEDLFDAAHRETREKQEKGWAQEKDRKPDQSRDQTDDGFTTSGGSTMRWKDYVKEAYGVPDRLETQTRLKAGREPLTMPEKLQELSQDMNRMPASWAVRSHALEGKDHQQVRWNRQEAHVLAQKASQLPPNHSASVFQTKADTMREKLEAVYTHGRNAFAEREQGRSR
jgi:hypothetical protein